MKTEDLLGIVKMTQANGLVPTLLCGDMNCVNPLDLPSRQRLVNGFSNFSKTPEKDVLRFLEGGEAIFSALETVGFRDAMPKSGRHYSIPTDLLNSNKITAMRLDHMFANTLIQVVGGTVVEDQDAEWASDHRPLYLDIESIMLGNIATSELP
jgi:endonuclease/exonuclease/phosphatase family metal-dependent hydrolase